MQNLDPTKPDELPRQSPEMLLWRASVEAFLVHIGRENAREYLHLLAEILASEEALSMTFPIRPTADSAESRRARRAAIAMFRTCVPVFLARIPPKD